MFKQLFILSMSVILISMFSIVKAEQTFTYKQQPRPSKTSPQKTPGSRLSPGLSPEDYRKRVEAADQQNKMTLNQEVAQSLAKVPPTPPPVAAAPKVTGNQPATVGSPPMMNNQSTQTISPIQSSPQKNSGSAQRYPNTGQTIQSQPNTSPTFSTQHQGQVYTGFQAPPPRGTTGTAQQPKSGGWNIKY